MANYKYPYIADKNLYRAVMGACSYIRETGWFNKATEYYADQYGVDVEDVRREVRRRQGAGQRTKNQKSPPKKYTWYAIQYAVIHEGDEEQYWNPRYNHFAIKRALTFENAERSLWSDPRNGLDYSVQVGRSEGFDKKEDAEDAVLEWRKKHERETR